MGYRKSCTGKYRCNVHEVHFTTKDMTYAYVVLTYEKGSTVYCEIPNILLPQEKSLICYEVTTTDKRRNDSCRNNACSA